MKKIGKIHTDLYDLEAIGLVNGTGNKKLHLATNRIGHNSDKNVMVLDEISAAKLIALLREFIEWEA